MHLVKLYILLSIIFHLPLLLLLLTLNRSPKTFCRPRSRTIATPLLLNITLIIIFLLLFTRLLHLPFIIKNPLIVLFFFILPHLFFNIEPPHFLHFQTAPSALFLQTVFTHACMSTGE